MMRVFGRRYGREEVPRERVVGAVVDDHDLEIVVRLAEDTLNGLVEICAEVEAGDDDGNGGRHSG
jgi:hypothetical protein